MTNPHESTNTKSNIQTQLTNFEETDPAKSIGSFVIPPRTRSRTVLDPAVLPDEVAFQKWPYSLHDDGVLLLGILHNQPQSLTRTAWAITHYKPDVIAVEAPQKVVTDRHPRQGGVDRQFDDEIDVAAYATAVYDWLEITGMDSQPTYKSKQLGSTDTDIFREWGLLDENEDLSLDLYRQLSLEQIRDWRTATKNKQPDLYKEILAQRDDGMAGHLHSLRTSNQPKQILAIVGIQHLTGILSRLRNPDRIPDRYRKSPVTNDFRIQ